MQRVFHRIRCCLLLWGVLPLLLGSCSFGDEPSPCPYDVRLEYWYSGSGVENMLPRYVSRLTQFIFDADGKLFSTSVLTGDEVSGWKGTLPDGTYTVVLWGNLSDADPPLEKVERDKKGTNDANDGTGDILDAMTLSAVTEGAPPGYRGNTSRLYYGTGTFTLKDGMTERRRIYLCQAYASLSVTVRWQTTERVRLPADGVYRMRLKGIPSVYSFSGGREVTVPSGDGNCTLPRTDRTVTYHEAHASLNYENEVVGELVTFRYAANTHELWSLWCNGKQLVRDLDLYLFFRKLPMDMDTNMEQDFDLEVTVYDDNRVVVTQASAADWEEGGGIG